MSKPRIYPDLETYSDLDIKKVSLDRYASHPSTRILMCAYAFDEGPVHLWQHGDPGLDDLKQLLRTHVVIPWNCGFERNLLRYVWRLGGLEWLDAMVYSLYAGMPAGLKDCNRVPFFAGEAKTSKEALLINKFCKPQKDGSKRNKETDPEDWELFCQYCRDDVSDTRLIFHWVEKHYAVPERVTRAWRIDQLINHRGMPIDRPMTERGHVEGIRLQAEAAHDLKELTGLDNPNSPAQLLRWLKERGYPYDGLAKELVKKALNEEPDLEGTFVDD